MVKLILVLVLAVVAVVGVGAAGLTVLGDSDDSDNGSSSVPTPASANGEDGDLTAEEVLEQSAERIGDVESFHFVLTHENGTTPLPLNLALESAEGDIVVPDRMQAEADAEALGIDVTVEVIGIEGRTWVTNPFTRQWQELADTNIRDFADPAALVSGILPAIQNPELEDGGSMDGVETHRINGTVDSASIQDALGIAEPGHEARVEAWIGKDDQLPRRVRLLGPLSDADNSEVVRQVDISRYDEPVEIMPPE